MKIILALLLTALMGCQSLPKAKEVDIPASLLQPCPALVLLEGTTGKHLLKNIVDNADIYHRCSDSHNKLIEAVKPNK